MASITDDVRIYDLDELGAIINFLGNSNYGFLENEHRTSSFSQNYGQKAIPLCHRELMEATYNKFNLENRKITPRVFGELVLMTKCLPNDNYNKIDFNSALYPFSNFAQFGEYIGMPNWAGISKFQELSRTPIATLMQYTIEGNILYSYKINIGAIEGNIEYYKFSENSLILEVLVGLFLGALKINKANFMYHALKDLPQAEFQKFIKKYENATSRDEISEFSEPFSSRTARSGRPRNFTI